MAAKSNNLILKKLVKIEETQKEMIKDWSILQDFILELTSRNLQKDINQGRKAYQNGKTMPYRRLRTTLKLS